MICYRDMTFCEAACANASCPRKLTDQVWRDAERWWGSKDAPVAISDCSETCADFQQKGSSQ